MVMKRKMANPSAGPDELLREYAKIGLRQVMLANQRAEWRLQQARQELDRRQEQAQVVAQIVGDPLAEERALYEQRQQHREHMARQRQQDGRDPFWEPIAVTSR